MTLDFTYLPKGPLLIFNAEELNTIRAMLLRSDWRCAVTERMRRFLETLGVTEHLERKRREAALAAAERAGAFYPEQIVKIMFRVEPEITIDKMDERCEIFRKTSPGLFKADLTGLFPRERQRK